MKLRAKSRLASEDCHVKLASLDKTWKSQLARASANAPRDLRTNAAQKVSAGGIGMASHDASIQFL